MQFLLEGGMGKESQLYVPLMVVDRWNWKRNGEAVIEKLGIQVLNLLDRYTVNQCGKNNTKWWGKCCMPI